MSDAKLICPGLGPGFWPPSRDDNAEFPADLPERRVEIGFESLPGPSSALPQTAEKGARGDIDRAENGQQNIGAAQTSVDLKGFMKPVALQNPQTRRRAVETRQLDDGLVIQGVRASVHHMNHIVTSEKRPRFSRQVPVRVRAGIACVIFGQALCERLLRLLEFKRMSAPGGRFLPSKRRQAGPPFG